MSTDRIMIVDDNPTNLMVLEEIVHLCGFTNTISECDPKAALDILSSLSCHTLLLDQNMPHFTGIEFYQHLKRNDALPERVFMISALDDPELRNQALGIGFDGFLPKPYRFADIKALLSN